jgi:PEP-CTERM/exosortase A-associated glycosyltransferase
MPPDVNRSPALRILHVLDHSVPLHSGYSFRTLAILRQQRSDGHLTFQLTSPKHGKCAGPQETCGDVSFFRTPPGLLRWVPLARQADVLRALRTRLHEVARATRPDVLHAHSPALNAVAALSVGRELGIPVVYEVRAFWEDAAVDHGTAREWGVRYRLGRALETWALRRADAIATISEGMRAEMATTRGLDAARITVVPNAVDLDEFPLLGAPDPAQLRALGLEGKKVLAFAGSFYAYEGLDMLIESLRHLPDEVHLLLVGGGPLDGKLRALARELRVDERVVFTGRVPHDEVRHYYRMADLMVYPRKKMRLTDLVTPLKPLEAMAQGKAVVASDVGGHRELIRDGETGSLFAAGYPRALAEKVLALLQDEERRQAQCANARAFVEARHTWKASVGRYRDVYRQAFAAAGA